ncbi:AraC family transcriptional regulator [Lacihabitans lacunae]|uniref:AraC family transcriptional regulator n=1 Tax=Lacihabitans lacunae TaxID=1028214 RepID=A0ABV7Z1D8_9BACT
MKLEFEKIVPDKGSSMRVLHHRVTADQFEWSYHYHPEVELILVLEGNGRRHVGSHVSYYDSGDLVLIGSNLPHSGFGYGATDIHEEIVIQFKADLFEKEIPEWQDIQNLLIKSLVGISFSKKTKNAAIQYFQEILTLNGLAKFHKLQELLAFLAKQNGVALNQSINKHERYLKGQVRVVKIFDFVENHFNEDINTNHIAELVNMTLPAFCLYFKKQFKVTFTDFLMEYRINQACKMLLEHKPVSEVAFNCGFNSLSYFSRTFKLFKQMSPSSYVRLYKSNE